MLFQDGRALQSIIWPVYMLAHEAGILGLRLWTAPVQVQEPNRVCAVRLCPAARHMSCVTSRVDRRRSAIGCS